MCQRAITLISNALFEVTNAELLLKIKGVIALFIQTMSVKSSLSLNLCPTAKPTSQSWGYLVRYLDAFLLTLFDKYAELLKRRFSDDFQEVRHYSECT